MGVGPIPWTALAAYADRMGIHDGDDFAEFAQIIGGLDSFYLDEVASRQKKNSEKAKAPDNKPRRR